MDSQTLGQHPAFLVELAKSFRESIAGKALELIVGAAIGWVGRKLLARRPARLLLGLGRPKTLKVVIGSAIGIDPRSGNLHPTAGVPFIGYGPLFAFRRIAQLLTKAYPDLEDYEVSTSRTFAMQGLGSDLIVLGWPGGNAVTQKIVEDVELPVRWNGHTLIDAKSGHKVFEPVIVDDHVHEDYGVIVKIANPYASHCEIVILAGGETFGVHAAAEFFDTDNLIRLQGFRKIESRFLIQLVCRLIPKRYMQHHYVAVVKAKIRDGFMFEPVLAAYYPIE